MVSQCRCSPARLLLALVLLLPLIHVTNALAVRPNKPTKTKVDDSPYYSYKTFKRMGVPAILYSAVAKAAGKLVQLKPQEINPTTTPSCRRVALVTGCNTGVGFATAKSLVREHGFEVIVACRDQDKGIQACRTINSYSQETKSTTNNGGMAVFVQTLDLADFESVRAFSNKVLEQYETIDVLINNAGRNSAGPATTANDNNDDTQVASLDVLFQTNFLGHFLLTNLLLDKCERIVNLSSVMHHFPVYSKKDNIQNVASTEYWKRNALDPQDDVDHDDDTDVRKPYAASKLAALLFTKELNRRYKKSKGIQSIAVNPGSVNSDIWRNYSNVKKALFQRIYLSPEQGSTTSVAASVLDFEDAIDEDDDDNSVLYLQPYWIPFQKKNSPPYPLFEMLGPYRGYCVTQPRLPEDGGKEAGRTLIEVCEELTDCKFPIDESVVCQPKI